MDLSRKVAPFDPQMVRDAISHYQFIHQHLNETADEMESQADGFRERATDAKLRAEHLSELLEEFPDGRGTQHDGADS